MGCLPTLRGLRVWGVYVLFSQSLERRTKTTCSMKLASYALGIFAGEGGLNSSSISGPYEPRVEFGGEPAAKTSAAGVLRGGYSLTNTFPCPTPPLQPYPILSYHCPLHPS